MIKAVIFDCFGVLTTDGWKQVREEFFYSDPEKLQHSIDMDKAVNAGFMNYADFLKEISTMTGLSTVEVRNRLNGSAPNVMLFEYIEKRLKPTMKIGMLSNAAENWLNELFEEKHVQLFDETVLSYEAGMVKPDPAIYDLVLSKLGVAAEEAVFIDDSERYVVVAEELGIKGILHRDTHETIARIEEVVSA